MNGVLKRYVSRFLQATDALKRRSRDNKTEHRDALVPPLPLHIGCVVSRVNVHMAVIEGTRRRLTHPRSLSWKVVDSVGVLADGEELGAVLLRELPKSIPSCKLMKKLLRSRRVHRRAQGAPCWESTGVRRAAGGGRQPAAHTQPASVRRAAAARFRTRCWQWECA
jgi:hypothetical protein